MRFIALFTIVAIAAAAAEPNDDAATEAKMAAVNKVITLLEDLQKEVLAEGVKESKTYNTFACFCKQAMAEKSDSIKAGEDEKTSLSAKINDLSSEREELDKKIEELMQTIKDTEAEIEEAVEEHEKALAEYQKNEADLSGALDALKGAIKVLKASKDPSLAQMQEIGKTVRAAVLMADAMGIGGTSAQRAVGFFLQRVPDITQPDIEKPSEDYKFHSDDIVVTLEKLLTDFTAEKTDLDAEETKRVAAHEAFMEEKKAFLEEKNTELDDTKKEKAEKMEKIAFNSQQLSTIAATLLDDQEYLRDVSDMCSAKAKTYDQRIQVRQDELSALTAAIGIIKGTVSEKTSAATIRFAQAGVSVRLAEAMAKNEDAMEADEADAEDDAESDGAAPVLLSVMATRHRTMADGPVRKGENDGGRAMILNLLRSRGHDLRSKLLTALATQIAEDPFAKVKQLIQELIDRMLTESAGEANQKGWCDKAISDAEQKREYAAEEVAGLNAEMAQLESVRDKLTEALTVLKDDIEELKKKRAEAEKIRAEEKAENEATVTEASAGEEAVSEAIDILDKFYKTAAKSKVDLSLAQKGPLDDAPDAGFEDGEAYTGAGDSAGGVIGMLEVIKSDFKRTISETRKAEAQAEQDNLSFMTETGKSLAEKEMAEQQKTKQKDDAVEKLEAATEGLQSQNGKVVTSIKELLELQPVCVDTGMSYEERVAARQEEIDALKKALCILVAYAEYGPDGAAGEC